MYTSTWLLKWAEPYLTASRHKEPRWTKVRAQLLANEGGFVHRLFVEVNSSLYVLAVLVIIVTIAALVWYYKIGVSITLTHLPRKR